MAVKNSPEALARMIHARCGLIKNDDLEYRLDPKTAKKLTIEIAELIKSNYEDHFDDDYYDQLMDCVNKL